MNIFEYLDSESPEINHALAHGFRKGDSNAVGRALLEEIKARKTLVKQLATQIRAVESVDRQAVDVSGLQASVSQQQENINQQQENINQQGETLSQQGETLNQQQELINLQQELIEQQQEESSNQLLKIGELEQDVADANSRIDALITGLATLLQQLRGTTTTTDS
jgi:prophage DNA circulation protein